MIFTEYLMFRAPVFLDEYLHFFPGFRGTTKVLETHKNWIDKNPIKSLQVSSKWFIKQKKEHDQ